MSASSLSPSLSKLPTQIQEHLNNLPADAVMVACSAPVNIAVIKYWGKRDEQLILPVNSSLSACIDPDTMCSTTVAIASATFTADEMILNGKQENMNSNKRLQNVLTTLRIRCGNPKLASSSSSASSSTTTRIRLVSYNNFPTAAGLASSASGFACLAATLAQLFEFKEAFAGELSTMARIGSGSACRSMYPGWVSWQAGTAANGTDSIAVPHFSPSHWPDMRILIFVASAHQKDTSSTTGMQQTVNTSALIQHRASVVVPARITAILSALQRRDFAQFGDITMADSNQFHAVCLDTLPPIFYMNDTSKQMIKLIHAFNAVKGNTEAAYTFDAGPNGVIFTEASNIDTLFSIFQSHFEANGAGASSSPSSSASSWIHDPVNLLGHAAVDEDVKVRVLASVGKPAPHLNVAQCIVTKVGDGPRVLLKHTPSS